MNLITSMLLSLWVFYINEAVETFIPSNLRHYKGSFFKAIYIYVCWKKKRPLQSCWRIFTLTLLFLKVSTDSRVLCWRSEMQTDEFGLGLLNICIHNLLTICRLEMDQATFDPIMIVKAVRSDSRTVETIRGVMTYLSL